jgi:hypothetical protein
MEVLIGRRKVLSRQDGWGTQNVSINQRSLLSRLTLPGKRRYRPSEI